MIIPGGQTIKKLIGSNTAVIIKHDGRIKTNECIKKHNHNVIENTNHTNYVDIDNGGTESNSNIEDLSLMTSGISLQVLKDVRRH